ncbi:MAG: alpha/beta hydrolase fold domain-containing protein [Bacteroidota bacterium]
MKSFFTALFTLLAALSGFSQRTEAGTRYKDIVFASAASTIGVQFGSALALDGSTLPLLVDVYEPAGDSLQLRPLVICIHGGSLAVGSRSEMAAFCTDFAQRGYVAATIDYRLGIEAPKGVTTIEEALLRGVQDAKGAVRFFRAHAADYKIDTTRIYIEGSSAGSMIAVHYAYWNEDEIPPEVNQTKWGDIEGTSGNPGYSSAINGIVNYCGAILDPRWIDAGELPVGNFHGLLDTVVPPDSGVSSDFGIKLFGGVAVSRAAVKLGIYHHQAFFPLTGHGGNEDSLRRFAPNFFYSLMTLASTAPNAFISPALSAKSLNIFRYDTYPFLTTALDLSGNRILLPASWVQYSCSSAVGTIDPAGIFTPADHPDSGYVYVQFNTAKDSCFVKTYDIQSIALRPKYTVTDTIHPLQLSIDTYDTYSIKHDLAMTMFTLSSTDPSVGTVDSAGIFRGKKSGTTSVVASFKGHSDTCVIKVESAVGAVTLDQLESIDGWTFTGENIDSLSVTSVLDHHSEGDASLKIYYKTTYSSLISSYMIYLNKEMPLYGIPDSILLDVQSDGRRHRLYYSFADVDSELYRASGKKYLNDSVSFDDVSAPMTGLSPVGGAAGLTYPLTLKRIEIQVALDRVQGVSTSGTIYVDNLRLRYPGSVSGVGIERSAPREFILEQNFPNPFNPATTIRYGLPSSGYVSLRIYNILGQQVADIVHSEQSAGVHETVWNAHAASGVYFYRIDVVSTSDPHQRFTQLKKMQLIK